MGKARCAFTKTAVKRALEGTKLAGCRSNTAPFGVMRTSYKSDLAPVNSPKALRVQVSPRGA